MRINLLGRFFGIVSVAAGLFGFSAHPGIANETNTFYCDEQGDKYATFVKTPDADRVLIIYKTEEFENFPPSRRCDMISKRLQEGFANEELNGMSYKKVNGSMTICATEYNNAPCRLHLMNVPSEADVETFMSTLYSQQEGFSSQVLINHPSIYSSYSSYTDGWNGEQRPYWNLDFLRTSLLEEESN